MGILSTQNANFTYTNKTQTVHAVKDVNCSFDLGKCYAIVGKSGSGKTTLLSLLAGLETTTDGHVFYREQDVAQLDRDLYRRDNAAVIYQSYNLFPLLTAEENVLYPLRLKKMNRSEAKTLAKEKLRNVGIAESQFKRFPAQLSGGEQQRVAIARALAAGSEIILADEPTGNLDITNGEQVIAILLRLAHEENRCVIVVTHDLEIASQMDVVFTMRDGILQQDGEL